MPDTRRTLDAFLNASTGLFKDANDISAQYLRDFAKSTYLLDYSADESVAGATTATIGKWHLCSGTSADYIVTLPAASGNTGQLIGFRMASGLTKLVTIDANSTELIDGAETRVMWANEVAILFCNGTGWTKIAGKTIPMLCRMRLNAHQNIGPASVTKVTLNTTDHDNVGSMASTGSNQITVRRSGKYVCGAKVFFEAFPAAGKRIRAQVHQTSTTGTQLLAGEVTSAAAGDQGAALVSDVISQNAGDVVILAAYHDHSSGVNAYGSNPGDSCYLSLSEVVQW